MNEHICLILLWSLCTYLTYAAVKRTAFMQCFNTLEANGGLLAALFTVGSVLGVMLYVVMISSSKVSVLMKVHQVVGILILAVETFIILKSWKSE